MKKLLIIVVFLLYGCASSGIDIHPKEGKISGHSGKCVVFGETDNPCFKL